MWKTWLKIETDLLQNCPFDPILELAGSEEGAKLFSGVPQMDLPAAAALTPNYSTSLDDVQKHTTVKINPVNFEWTAAIVESPRLGHAHTIKGKILACRLPDLMIRHNIVPTSRTWERFSPPQEGTS